MKKISNKEFAWYLGCGIVALFGLILIVFGIIGYHMNAPIGENFIRQFEKKLPLDLRTFGIIFVAVGVLVGIIVLLWNAKRADRDIEKRIRREQRIAAQSSQSIEVKKAVEVVEEQK